MNRLVASLCLAPLLVACGVKSPDGERESRYEVRVATPGSPRAVDERNWERFVANVGVWAPEFHVELLPPGKEGATGNSPLEDARSGLIQIAGLSLADVADVVPEVAVLSAPYLFESQEEADYLLDEVLLEPFRRLFAESDLRLLQWVDVGWVHLYSREPILEPGQMKDARLAASPSVLSQAFAQALSAELVPLRAHALLQGPGPAAIDVGMATVQEYAMSVLASEAPNYLLTGHALDIGVLVANRSWFQELTPHDKGVFEEAFRSAGQARADTRQAAAEALARLETEGVKVHRLSPDQRRAWAAASHQAQASIIARAGGRSQEIYDLVLAGKAAFAAQAQPGSGTTGEGSR